MPWVCPRPPPISTCPSLVPAGSILGYPDSRVRHGLLSTVGRLARSWLTSSTVFIYHRSNNNGTISTVLKYDSAANITTGYALLGPRISLEDLCTKLRSQFPAFAHPLLVSAVLLELTATDLMRELYHINRLLTASEYKTQSGDWEIKDSLANADPNAAPKPAALVLPPAPGEASWWHDAATAEMQNEPSYWKDMSREMQDCTDNHQLARILGFLGCRFAFMNAAVQCSLATVEFTLQEIGLMNDYVAPANRRRLRGVMNGAALRDRAELLQSNLRHMAVFAAIGPRMQTQQTVVSALALVLIVRHGFFTWEGLAGQLLTESLRGLTAV